MSTTDPRWSRPRREPAPSPEAWLARLPRCVEARVPVAALHAQSVLRPAAGIEGRLDALEGVLEGLAVERVEMPEALRTALYDIAGALGALADLGPLDRLTLLGGEVLSAHRAEEQRRVQIAAERSRLAATLAPPDLSADEAELAVALGRIVPGPAARHAHHAVRRAPELVGLLVALWAETPAAKRPSSVLLAGALERAGEGRPVVDLAEQITWILRGLQTAAVEARGAPELAKLVDKYQRHLDKLGAAFESELAAAFAAHEERRVERAAAADAVAEEIANVRAALRRLENTRPNEPREEPNT